MFLWCPPPSLTHPVLPCVALRAVPPSWELRVAVFSGLPSPVGLATAGNTKAFSLDKASACPVLLQGGTGQSVTSMLVPLSLAFYSFACQVINVNQTSSFYKVFLKEGRRPLRRVTSSHYFFSKSLPLKL